MDLFSEFRLGPSLLENRLVMAPMTRNRASLGGVVTDIMVEYYRQRAGAGLIISESSPVSKLGIGYPCTPGIFNYDQVEGWKRLVSAVHDEGGKIFIQLQHCGRISHPSMNGENLVPVAPSAIRPEGQAITYAGMQDYVVPRALETFEIAEIVGQFLLGAAKAREAGFDGIEVHGANGYIIDQFLRDGTNKRDDAYGGSVKNRMRILNEILDAVSTIWDSSQIGVRLTPENSFNSMLDSAPQKHFEYFAEELGKWNLAYLHVLEGDMANQDKAVDYTILRRKFGGVYIANNGYTKESAQASLSAHDADLIAFGTPFLANPDLVQRFKNGLSLNQPDHSTYYGGDQTGYTDYPTATL